jgi:hypothetical protein
MSYSSSDASDVQMQEDDSSATSSSSAEETPFDSQTQIQEAQHRTSTKLSELAESVESLIEKYANNSDELVHDPIRVYGEMSQACSEMKATWEEYHSDMASIEKVKEAQSIQTNKKFRDVYMNLVTEAFADELDDLRHGKLQNDDDAKKKMKNLDESILQQDNIVIPKERNSDGVNVDMEILAEMLESGMEGWDQEQKELLLQDWKVSQGEGTMELEELTPHERRRRVIFGK